jgi:hypothetical protein
MHKDMIEYMLTTYNKKHKSCGQLLSAMMYQEKNKKNTVVNLECVTLYANEDTYMVNMTTILKLISKVSA